MRRIAPLVLLAAALVIWLHAHPLRAQAARFDPLPSAHLAAPNSMPSTAAPAVLSAVQASSPDLSLTLSDGGVALIPSSIVIYTLTYSNAGGAAAGDVRITVEVPNRTTFNPSASTAGWTCTPNVNPGSDCTLSIGTLAAGGGGTAIYAVTVNSSVPSGSSAFVFATIFADDTNGGETNLSNNGGFVITFAYIAPIPLISFFPPGTGIGQTARLSVLVSTLGVMRAVTLTNVSIHVTLSDGIRVAANPNLGGGCSGALNVSAMRDSLTMSGMTFAPNSSCTLSFDVTGVQVGQWPATASVDTAETGVGQPVTTTLPLKVIRQPVLTKSFRSTAIPAGAASRVVLTLTNPADNLGAVTVGLIDEFPTGLVRSGDGNLSVNGCGNGDAMFEPTRIVVPVTIATPGGTCAIEFDVTSATPGTYVNLAGGFGEAGVIPTGSDTLKVFAPPQFAMSFAPASIPAGGATRLTFTITNPMVNPGDLVGVGLTSPFPSGLVVQGNGNLNSTGCIGGTIAPTVDRITLTDVSVAAGTSCVFSVDVTSATPGEMQLTMSALSRHTDSSQPATATLTVIAPPRIAKAFSPAVITLDQISVLTITVTNPSPNTINLAGVGFTDTLPAGLAIHTPPNLTTTGCGTNASVTGPSISLSGATVAPGVACVVTVTVRATSGGVTTNTTSAVTSSNGGTGLTASATLTVDATPPELRLRFDPATRGVVVEAIDEGGSGLTTTGPLAPATCTTQRTGEQCLYRATDQAGNATTLTFLLTKTSTSTTVRVVSVQYSGRAPATPLTHSATFTFAPATGTLSSLTQTLTVVEGSSNRKVESRFPASGMPGGTQVTTTVGGGSTTETCSGQTLLWLRTSRTNTGVALTVDPPCPL